MGLTYQFCYQLSKIVASELLDFQVFGREHCIEEGPALYAANHQSFLDPPLAAISLDREIFYLARKTLFKPPIMSRLLPQLNVIPLDRDGTDMTALKVVIRTVRQGNATIVFPEGTRSQDGSLQAAKPGLGLLVAKTGAPVVPMRIFGSFNAWPRGSRFPRPSKVTVVIGKPLYFADSKIRGDARSLYQSISEEVMRSIAALENPRRD